MTCVKVNSAFTNLLQCNMNFAVRYMLVQRMTAPIFRPDDMRKGNRQRIVSTLRRAEALSRTDIAAATGLSAATVSAITSDLLAEGILRQASSDEAGQHMRGRPKVALAVNADAALVGAVILQLDKIDAAIVDYAGNVVAEASVTLETLKADRQTLRQALTGCLREALIRSRRSARLLRRIAVGVQGVTDVEGSSMLWSPVTRHTDLPIREWMDGAFGVPARLSNDCDLIARALNWRDVERYGDNFAAVLLSHGVGMGLFLRGGIINGTRSSGIEFGHMVHRPQGALCRCGSRGCIEAYAGDYGIERRARRIPEATQPPGLMHEPDIAEIARAASDGNVDARSAIEDAGLAIGYGLADLYALVDSFPVVLVGRSTVAASIMEPAIRSALAATTAGQNAEGITIDWMPDEAPLIREGCAVNALLWLDDDMALAAGDALSAVS